MTQVSSTKKSRFFTAAMGHNFWFNVKDNMKLMIVIFVLHFAAAPLLLITILTQLATNRLYDIDDGFMAAAVIGTGLAAASGMICALSVFKYLYNKSAVDMRLSLPMTTGQRFVSDFFSGLFVYIVPYLAAELVSLMLTLAGHLIFDGRILSVKNTMNDGTIQSSGWECHFFEQLYPYLWRVILGGLILMVMFYVITVITACCCGNIFESVAYDILLCGLVPLTALLGIYAVSNNVNGLDSEFYQMKLLPWCGPFGGAYGLVLSLMALSQASPYRPSLEYDLSFGKWFVIFTLITAALVFVSILIYRKRKAEDTGKPVVFGIFYHILMTLGIFSLCYLMLTDDTTNFVPVFVISFILYFVMHVIRNRGFGKIVKGLVIYAATVLLSIGSLLVIHDTKCFGAGDYVPEADKISKAEVSYTGQFDSLNSSAPYVKIRDPEALKILTQAHKEIIEYYNSSNHSTVFRSYLNGNMFIKYTLNSGRSVTRRYYTAAGSTAIDTLSELDTSEEVKQARAENARYAFSEELDRLLKEYDEGYDATVSRKSSRSDLFAEITPQWTYSEGGNDYHEYCRIGYNDLPSDFGEKLGECLYADIIAETPEEYYTPSGRMWKLNVYNMKQLYIKDSYENTMAYLSSCGFTELPEVTRELAEKYISSGIYVSMLSMPLIGYMTGQELGTSSYTSTDYFKYKNIDINTQYISDTYECYDDLLTLLNHSYKEYKTDESCYTIIVNGNCAVIPAEYSEIAERVFIRATADKAEQLNRQGFWTAPEKIDNYGNYEGYSIYLEKLIEFYGRDKIVSALSFYYDRSTAEKMFEDLSEWSKTDTDFFHSYDEDIAVG